MIPYTPATQDQLLAIRVNAGIEELAQSERFAAAEPDMVEAIVDGVGQFSAGEFAPLNRIGDLEGAKLENGVVRLPDGFKSAYDTYVEQGWNAIASPGRSEQDSIWSNDDRRSCSGFYGICRTVQLATSVLTRPFYVSIHASLFFNVGLKCARCL